MSEHKKTRHINIIVAQEEYERLKAIADSKLQTVSKAARVAIRRYVGIKSKTWNPEQAQVTETFDKGESK